MSPAPKGNRFWELRSKHGRDRLFKTPDLLWEAASEYFDWILENPLIEIDFMGKEVQEVEKPHIRPFTLHGLCAYLDCNTAYFSQFEESLKRRTDKESKDFSNVITRIRETIYRQKFEGAACGFYNANIIARDLGITDKQEIDHTTKGDKINKIIVSTEDQKKHLDDFFKAE